MPSEHPAPTSVPGIVAPPSPAPNDCEQYEEFTNGPCAEECEECEKHAHEKYAHDVQGQAVFDEEDLDAWLNDPERKRDAAMAAWRCPSCGYSHFGCRCRYRCAECAQTRFSCIFMVGCPTCDCKPRPPPRVTPPTLAAKSLLVTMGEAKRAHGEECRQIIAAIAQERHAALAVLDAKLRRELAEATGRYVAFKADTLAKIPAVFACTQCESAFKVSPHAHPHPNPNPHHSTFTLTRQGACEQVPWQRLHGAIVRAMPRQAVRQRQVRPLRWGDRVHV